MRQPTPPTSAITTGIRPLMTPTAEGHTHEAVYKDQRLSTHPTAAAAAAALARHVGALQHLTDPQVIRAQAKALRESVEAIFQLPPAHYWPEVKDGEDPPTDAELVQIARAQGWQSGDR